MIQEITLTKRVQTPTPPNEWLYQDQSEDFRYFTKRVLLGKNAEPWPECTDEEKEKWEEKIIDLYPEAPCVWLWRDGEPEVKREFYPSVTIRMEDEPLWHECEDRYKVGYELLWDIRQVEHTEEELAELQAQYDAWKETNPDLVEEIEVSVPIKPEPNAEENEGE